MKTPSPSAPLRALLQGIVDYAGLFPPAGLDMAEAVAKYAEYRSGPHAWMLGRFVVPAGRLQELAGAVRALPGSAAEGWQVSAIIGEDLETDLDALDHFNRGDVGATVDAAELKADSVPAIERAAQAWTSPIVPHVELPVHGDPTALIDALGRHGWAAKVRTGGVTVEAFPPAAHLARFIRACSAAGVPFKATAGLHHPLRTEHALTYEADAPRGIMYGFLNLFLAAAFVRAGVPDVDVEPILLERSPLAFRFEADAVRWHGHRVSQKDIEAVRAGTALSFGSCSFEEPVSELRTLNLI